MTDPRQRAGERFADMVHQIVVRQSGVAEADREDDQICEKVGCAEGVRVDVHGAQDARVRHAGEEGRVQRDHLIVQRADRRDLDARVQDDPESASDNPLGKSTDEAYESRIRR